MAACRRRRRLYDNTIILRGFSKSHAMTGWRLGYAAGPEAIIAQMTKLQQYTFVCAPSPLQYAAAGGDGRADGRRRRRVPAQARHRVRDAVARSSRSSSPEARSTSSPRPPPARRASDFVTRAIENNVLIIPGNVFSERDTHFRISYATTDEKLKQGCEILCALTA